MLGNITGRMIGVGPDKNEAPVAIAAVDIAPLVDLEPDAWMAQCGRYLARAITDDARTIGANEFGLVGHVTALSDAKFASPDAAREHLEVNDCDTKLTAVIAGLLVCSHVQRSADPDVQD
jgi:hypothetical protein